MGNTLARIVTGAAIGGALFWLGVACLAVLFTLAWSAPARAELETWTVLSCCSHHFDSKAPKDYEQHNWGLGIEHGSKALRVAGGFDRNSKRIDSVYFGVVATAEVFESVRVGAALVLVSGYPRAEKKADADKGKKEKTELNLEPVKGLLFVASWEGRRFGVNLLYVPETDENVAVIGLQLKYRWKGS